MRIKLYDSLIVGERVLCAVSGGADSMCLVHLLWSCGVKVTAAHFEHGIRGGESRRDARFVEDWCGEKGIACVIGHGDVPSYARTHSMGTEEAARLLRYEFLEKTAERLGCRYIATAHNSDDNAETMMFNLTRGTGAAGLRGIPARRGNIIRPLLSFSREDIEEYNRENSVPYVEDSTNLTDDYSRNLIRHRVIPVLRQINPGLNEACLRSGRLMKQDDDCLEGFADDFLNNSFDGRSVDASMLCSLHPAIASRVIRRMSKRSLSMEQTEAVLALCSQTERKECSVTGGRFVVERGRLYVDPEYTSSSWKYELNVGGSIYIPECGMSVRAEEKVYSGEINDLFKTLFLRCENIGSVSLTGRMPGDTMRPAGRNCTKSLKSLFLEKKLPSGERNTLPVIRDKHGILAVYGLAADERSIPLPGDRVINIIFEKLQEKREENAQGC